MKQGKPLITFVILAMAAVVCLYFAYYTFNALNEPYRTTQVYAYTAHDSVTAEGLVVRETLLLPAQNGILEVTRAEGEKVGKGQQVALVYQNTQAQASQAQIEELEMEIELLEYVTGRENSVDSAARLDEDILQAVVDLRSSYARGDYTQLRDQVMGVKSSVLKRGYTYGEGLASGDLTARLRQLKEVALEVVGVLPAGEQALAVGDGHAGVFGDVLHRLGGGSVGLLKGHDVVFFRKLGQLHGAQGVGIGVVLHNDVHLISGGLPDGLHAGLHHLQLLGSQ